MKTNKFIYILAIISLGLFASCNNSHNHSCDDHSNHEQSVNDSIME